MALTMTHPCTNKGFSRLCVCVCVYYVVIQDTGDKNAATTAEGATHRFSLLTPPREPERPTEQPLTR